MTSSAALAVGSVLVEAGPDPAAPRWNESAAMDPAVGHSSDPNLLVSSPSAEAEEEEGGVADIVSQAIGHSSDPNLIASPAVEEDEVAADIMSPAIGHSSDPNLISSPVHEEKVDDPHHHHPPLKRSSIAIDKEVDERIRRRVEALERRRRSSSGAVQVGIWRSYSLPWTTAADAQWLQQQHAAGGADGEQRTSLLPPSLHGSIRGCRASRRGEARRGSRGSQNAGAVAPYEGEFSPRTYDDEDDDDDSQDSDDYSDEESGTEESSESESETETIDPPPGIGGLERTVDMLKVATDPTVAETETDSERSSSSSPASEHPSDDELDAPAGRLARAGRRRRSPRKICGGGGGGGGRKRFDRQCSEMTHITECSESTDGGGGAFVSEEDSDDDYEGLRKKSSSETTERRRNRSRSIDSDGSFDILQVQVQTVPEETTDLVGKDIVATAPPKEVNGNSSNNDTTPECQEIDRSLFAIQSVRNLTYARGTNGDGSSGTLGVDAALAIEEEEQENLGEKKKEPENERLHLTAKEEEEGTKDEDTEAAIPDGSTPKRPKKARKSKQKKKKKKKRRQRLVMRRAAEEVLHESGFELDLMAPSDIDSSFHSKASTVDAALNSSRHSYGLSFLDSSRHSQGGGGQGLSSPPQFFLDSSRHSQGVAPPFLDSSCHSRGGRGPPFAGLDSSRHSRGGGRLRWSGGHGKNKQLRHSAGSSSGMRRSNSLLSLASQNSATGGGNLAVAPPPMTSLGRGCSQASVFSDDTSVGYDNQDNFLDFSIRDYTGIMPEIKRNLSADDLISLAAEDDDEDADAIAGNDDNGRRQQLFCSAPDGGRFLLLGASPTDDDASAVGLHVLSPPLAEALQSHLPFAVSGQNFWLKYSLVRDGANLMTLLDNVPTDSHTILAIETEEGEVFGSFTSSPWRKDWNYYGSGFGAFLWRMKGSRGGGGGPASSAGSGAEEASPPPSSPHRSVFDQTKAEGDVEVFKWSGRNDFTQLLTSEKMAVGGGAEKVADWLTGTDSSCSSCTTAPGFGLCVDDDMFQGTSSPCATFESPPLSKIHSDGSPFNILNVEVWALTPCISVEEALKMEVMKTFHAEMRSSA